MIDLEGLLETGRTSRLHVGIGLEHERLSRTAIELKRRSCSVELVGFGDAQSMAMALSNDQIDAAVRGALSSRETLAAVRELSDSGSVMRTVIMSGADGRPFMLTPVGIDEGNGYEQRLELARRTIAYLAPTGWRIDVGVLSKGRPEDGDRGGEIRSSLEDGEALERDLNAEGVTAKHYSILIEEAVRERDLIIAPDGVAGNLMFRTLHFLGAGRSYGAPIVNLRKVFVDTSRAKDDYSDAVLLAAGLAEVGCRA